MKQNFRAAVTQARQVSTQWIKRLLPLVAVVISLVSTDRAAADEPALATTEANVALQTFDQVWNQVREQYFDFERIETDWEQARETLRPQAAELTAPAGLRPLLHDLLERIGESHFVIIPGEAIEQLARLESPSGNTGEESSSLSSGPSIEAMAAATSQADTLTTGLSLRLVDEQVRVAGVRDQSAAAGAGIEPGWTVLAIDGIELSPSVDHLSQAGVDDEHRRAIILLELRLLNRASFIRPGQEVTLELTDTSGQQHRKTLGGHPLSHGTTQIGNLPPMAFDFSIDTQVINGGCVQVVAFSSWVPALTEAFRSQREQIFGCQGLVIDLRGNPGGVLTTMVPLAADLFDESVVLGSLLRSDARLDFRVLPRRVAMDGQRLQPFDGPVAILIDSLSASTSEMFAAGMQATGRAKLFGERSAGMALPSQMLPLANGDFLMYAFADYRDSQDRRIEGVGALPDFPVPLNDDNIHQHPSPVLQAALDWINHELSP